MTNFEHYKKEILNITNRGYNVAVVDNEPTACGFVQNCRGCQLANADAKWRCHLNRMEWLYEEYIEPPKQPKLTKKERQFCELVETGWICRTRIGILVYRLEDNKPSKDYTRGIWYGDNIRSKVMINVHEMFPSINFSLITWDDEEPWRIEDLLKLEVEE
jgi:hypothetical protein